jgi:hypothetical protein
MELTYAIRQSDKKPDNMPFCSETTLVKYEGVMSVFDAEVCEKM